jgi:hypothetical protein
MLASLIAAWDFLPGSSSSCPAASTSFPSAAAGIVALATALNSICNSWKHRYGHPDYAALRGFGWPARWAAVEPGRLDQALAQGTLPGGGSGRQAVDLFEHGQFGELLGGGLDPARRVRHGPGRSGDGEHLPGIGSLLADADQGSRASPAPESTDGDVGSLVERNAGRAGHRWLSLRHCRPACSRHGLRRWHGCSPVTPLIAVSAAHIGRTTPSDH